MATSKLRVLIVDDDTVLRALQQRGLTAAGYHAIASASGAEARRLLGEQKFDAVISELVLPGWGGLELIRWTRKQERAVPVLVFTGYDNPNTIAAARQAGAQLVLVKPVRLETLVQAIGWVLSETPTRTEPGIQKRAAIARPVLAPDTSPQTITGTLNDRNQATVPAGCQDPIQPEPSRSNS